MRRTTLATTTPPTGVLDGKPPPLPHKKGGGQSPPIFGHVYCGQTAAWIKLPLGMEVGLGQDETVLDGDPAPLPK